MLSCFLYDLNPFLKRNKEYFSNVSQDTLYRLDWIYFISLQKIKSQIMFSFYVK